MVFVAMSKICIDNKMAKDLEESFKNRSRKVENFDGFLGLFFLRSKKNTDEFRGVFRFKDEESFKRYMKSDLHKQSHNKTHRAINEAIKSNSVEFFDEISQ